MSFGVKRFIRISISTIDRQTDGTDRQQHGRSSQLSRQSRVGILLEGEGFYAMSFVFDPQYEPKAVLSPIPG